MAAVNLLRARGLSKSFGGVWAVREVDFDLQQGEIHAIIGPNGAGKTTFVSLLCGRIPANAGSVEFCGHDISALPVHQRVRRGIAYTFQITSIFPNLTVAENIAIAAQNRFRGDRSERSGHNRERSDRSSERGDHSSEESDRSPENGAPVIARNPGEVLDWVGLGGLRGQQAGALAYGHQRLLEAAMGLALNPLLLIFDEPTQGLSDGEIQRFCAVLREAARSATVLLIEHNMAVVMTLAQRITVFDRGRVLALGTPGEIQNDPGVQAAYLGR